MRQIKFRAWDWEKFGYVQIQGNLISCPVYKFMSLVVHDGSIRFAHVTDWQQFTGLLDKHGKEIYEGDICKTDVRVGSKKPWEVEHSWYAIYPVEFKDGGFRLFNSSKGNGLCDFLYDWTHRTIKTANKFDWWSFSWSETSIGFFNEVEVIGNIHENPELLK